jgi:dihydroneopterin aldolase
VTERKPNDQAQYTSTDHVIACQVLLNDIEVMADIGALAIELGVLQPLLIHVALTVVPPTTDDLTQTFDYSIIRRFAEELAAQRIVLIETFAQRLAQRCLAFEVVLDAEVRIDKPKAVPGCLAGTRIRMGKS